MFKSKHDYSDLSNKLPANGELESVFVVEPGLFYIIVRDDFSARAQFDSLRGKTLKDTKVYRMTKLNVYVVKRVNDDLVLFTIRPDGDVETAHCGKTVYVLSADDKLSDETKHSYVFGENIEPTFLEKDNMIMAVYDNNFDIDSFKHSKGTDDDELADFFDDSGSVLDDNNNGMFLLNNIESSAIALHKTKRAFRSAGSIDPKTNITYENNPAAHKTIRKEVYLNTHTRVESTQKRKTCC